MRRLCRADVSSLGAPLGATAETSPDRGESPSVMANGQYYVNEVNTFTVHA